jgi:hypothetical protein
MSPHDAAAEAQKEVTAIVDKWNQIEGSAAKS